MAEYNEVVSPLPYFGNITFYAHLVQQDMLIDLHEHYVKQSLRNRCELLGSQGPFTLSVPIHRPSGVKTPCKDIRISYAGNWQHEHLQAIRSAYGSAPFFIHYIDAIESALSQNPEYLVDLNRVLHEALAPLIGVPATLRMSDRYIESTPGVDLRPSMKTGRLQNERYIQVFSDRMDFVPDRSILDLLFCLGPECTDYLLRQSFAPPTS
ncbi:MAG: hypothetical protein HKN79_04235 [Flavobacteriales bacterium]|nr:hypothetical protein [Flavobacteriales bacterium]